MFNAVRFLSFVLVVFSFSNTVRAEITLGTPTYSGPGCPAGSVEVVFTPNQKALSVLYSVFTATALPKKSALQNCTLKVPILNIPNDKTVVVTRSDFQGFLSLPKNAFGYFNTIFQFRRGKQVISRDYVQASKRGPFEDNFYSEKTKLYGLNSGCGGEAVLEMTTSVSILNLSKENASYTIDTTNLVSDSEVPIRIALAQCRR